MRTFPQEIVDMVVDQLADSLQPSGEPVDTSHYSTVSRQWLDRTQKHHFEFVHLKGQLALGNWCTNIAPDPCGVSRHVRELYWWYIETLEGSDDHIRAFTHLEEVAFAGCGIFRWPSVVESLAPLGSSLVSLKIAQATTTYNIIVPLLAALPHLRHLSAHSLDVLDNRDVTGLPSRVPFFEDANCLDLSLDEDDPESLDWIPPSARFRELQIDASSILDESGRVQQWIASSARTLRFLSITGHPGGTYLNLFSSKSFPTTSLTVWFSPRPSFPPTRSLRVRRAGVPTTHDFIPSTWGTRRLCSPLPPLFSTSTSRPSSGGVMVRGGQPPSLGSGGGPSPSGGQTV